MRTFLLVVLLGIIACHAHLVGLWCYSDSMMGGHVPFMLLGVAVPMICAFMGYALRR
jgi:hypothetical protein